MVSTPNATYFDMNWLPMLLRAKLFQSWNWSFLNFADSPCNQPGDGILILSAYSENYAPGAVCEAANRAKLGRYLYDLIHGNVAIAIP